MTIYECLGIDHILLDQEIPKDLIIKNIEKEDLRHDAEFYFRVIDQVSLRASIQRGEDHFLQVLEITLNSPDFIREISFLIQKAIKYRVLFIFVFDGRYLIVRRSFNLTMSTENVHSDSAPFCSDWIYEEYLHLDILYSHRFCAVEEYAEADEEAVRLLKTDADNGDYILFKDLLSSAERLNKCIVESECISTRWFIDWLKIHVAGQRVEIGDFIERIEAREAYQFIGDYLFIDKTCARYAMTALDNTFYKLPSLPMDHTGKWPMRYFEGISSPSTHEEAEILSHAIQHGADDIIYLELQSHKADERRRLDDEHKRFLEERRREAEYRKAAEEQRKLDEWRKEWEQRRLELLQAENESEESNEDELKEDQLEFDDISFVIYDKDSIHIEFCNMEFDDYNLYMVFWINNKSGEDIVISTLTVAKDHIIGDRECSFGIEHIKAGGICRYRLPLEGITQHGKYDIDCITDIENGDGSYGYSQRFMLRVDFDSFSQSAEVVKGREIRLSKKYVAYDSEAEDVSVEFWGIEVNDEEVSFNFLVCNNREDSVNVFAMDIHVDGVKVVDHMHIGECNGERFCYGRFTLPQINSFGSHSIKTYIEIDDCEDCDYIDQGDVFKIDVDVNMGTLSARNYAQEEAAQRRLEEERRKVEEQRRLEEERRKAEEQRRLEEERRKVEEQRRLEEERRKAEEQRRLEEERRKAEEQRRLEEERRKAEEQCRLEEERRKAEEQRRLEDELRKAEEIRAKQPYAEQLVQLIDGTKKRSIQQFAIVLNCIRLQCEDYERYLQAQAELRRQAEQQRKAEEQRRLEEERRRAEEQRRLEEERRKDEERRRLEEQRRRAEEQRRLEEERRNTEEQRRLEEESHKTEEQRRLEEERRKAEEQYRFEQELARRKDYFRSQKLCQHCGGKFKGLFKKVCSNCGRSKDY